MTEKKDWTVMIYMAGDNNLSVDMAYTLEELQKKVVIGENDKINLFVHYQNNSPEIPPIYCDFSDFKNPVYKYSNEILNKFSDSKTDGFEISTAVDPVVDFVDWCVNKTDNVSNNKIRKKGEAENYALIFSGHTMGFLSLGLLKDETKNTSMTMPDLKKGLEIVKNEITGKKFALLGFDSCVMSMLEVGHQFKSVADTMIASEGSIPNAGWSYAEILGSLANSDKTVENTASEFVHRYIEKQSRYSIGGVSVDMSAWNLKKLDGLNNKFEELVKLLLICFKDESSVIYKQMRRILLQVHFNAQTFMYEQCVDLGDLCSLLIEELASLKEETKKELDPTLKNIYDLSKSVLFEIGNCIILSGFSGGSYQFATGISLFFPWSVSAFNVSSFDYEHLEFIRETKAGKLWNRFLQKYLGEISLRKAKQEINKGFVDLHQITFMQNNQVSFAHKVPMNPVTRVPMNPVTRVPMNPVTRVPMNPVTRVPLNPQVRLFGDSSKFFENFTNFKNIESNWNIKGYTKKV